MSYPFLRLLFFIRSFIYLFIHSFYLLFILFIINEGRAAAKKEAAKAAEKEAAWAVQKEWLKWETRRAWEIQMAAKKAAKKAAKAEEEAMTIEREKWDNYELWSDYLLGSLIIAMKIDNDLGHIIRKFFRKFKI